MIRYADDDEHRKRRAGREFDLLLAEDHRALRIVDLPSFGVCGSLNG